MKQYIITGMTCASCSAHIEKAVSKVAGVKSCSVNLLTNSMRVEGSASSKDIITAVKNAGYGATLKSQNEPQSKASPTNEEDLIDNQTPMLKRRFMASTGFLAVLMYVSMGHMMWSLPLPSFFDSNHVAMGLIQLILTVIIMIINQNFFISGFKSLWNRSPNMDSLVALGSTAAFVYSTFALFSMTDAQVKGNIHAVMTYMDEFYFESAAMILTLITLGKMLESRSKGKTTSALKGLMKLAPKTATILKDNKETSIPVEQVMKGDVFVVRPGENIPADGIIKEGISTVDESALTGESIPIDKTVGNLVSAGTINQSGFIRCEATKVGEDTTLSQIIQMVSDAAASKAPISKVADKVSGVFVPVVICIAILTIAVWLLTGQTIGFALARGISVLVISCPCALGLATPVAIMVGSGMGAKNGILFKTATSLEMAGKAQIVALDKTGTITKGEPQVTDILPSDGYSKAELLRLAYSLEQKSEHPLASAINQKAEKDGLTADEVSSFEVLPGNGLTALLNDCVIYGGNYSFISTKVEIPSEMKIKSEYLAQQGKTPMFFSHDNNLFGIIAVADVIKEDSPQAINNLQNMGINVIMLTGDNECTAKAIGKQAGVNEIIASVLPNEKESVIRRLKRKGKVIMVGDGINDAPALTSADIGIAIGAGTDIAIDSADIVLMKNQLSDVLAVIRLGRAALRNIHENLFWAFIYNIIGIPIAAGIFIPLLGWQLNPMFAAAAMSLSSFCVVTNALRLNLFKMNDMTNNKIKFSKKEQKIMEKTLKIEGMTCAHCEMHVKKALETVSGVKQADVSHKDGIAVVKLETDIPDEVLKKVVEEQSYTVREINE